MCAVIVAGSACAVLYFSDYCLLQSREACTDDDEEMDHYFVLCPIQRPLRMFVSYALHSDDLVSNVISFSLTPVYDNDNEDLHFACDLSDFSTSPSLLLLCLFSDSSTPILLLFLQFMRAGVYVADSYITPPYAAMRKWVKGSAMS